MKHWLHLMVLVGVIPLTSVVVGQPVTGWGVDACLSRHASAGDVGVYLNLLDRSGVKMLRERDIGQRVATAGETRGSTLPSPKSIYESDPRPIFRKLKAAGKTVVAFAGMADRVKSEQIGNALPEDLITVFRQGEIIARDFAGLVDAWEMVGEADVGYCTDLPDRVAAYQKALYLGIKAGASTLRSNSKGESGMLKGERADEDGKSGVTSQGSLSTLNAQLSTSARAPLVLMGALALPPGPWLERAMRNGLLDYTDAYNFHFYGHADDLAGVISAHGRVASRGTVLNRVEGRETRDEGQETDGGGRSIEEMLPLWITECGINAVPMNDYLNSERRKLQADFTTKAAAQALAAPRVAVFMPFILVHDRDPHAMTLSPTQPLPAWVAYAKFTREHPWPNRRIASPPVAANSTVVQWMPNNATTQAHKVSGSYRFMGRSAIKGELRIYNFSNQSIRGRLEASVLRRVRQTFENPDSILLEPLSCRKIPLSFDIDKTTGYVREDWSAVFVDSASRRSAVAFALETAPEDEVADFIEVPLALKAVGVTGSAHRFDPSDEVTALGKVWQGVNGLELREISSRSEDAAALQVWMTELRQDPLKARLAIAGLTQGLPTSGFLRLRLDRPMDRDFSMCVDLVDRAGQRFTIWENFGVSYFHPQTTDVWLNLADFTPYFWGRCTEDPRFRPEQIEEIELRFYISKVNDKREVSVAFMKQRD